ncbi:MAG: homocysteine S-methyltransferase family protein [Clostridiales bacterium]|jgi:5-methyltetrahydrofolate--homocysteine methyltransferase|nr:homocysteine S-methyltransferase family protein [Clostridiales bacterium]
MAKITYFDGAMGTMLQESGALQPGQLPETLNITHPRLITGIHKRYIEAGCDILKTNTFGANALKLKNYAVRDVITAAVEHARTAAGDKKVALDVGPTGKLLAPLGELSFDAAYEVFAEMIAAGRDSGADLVLIETMSDTYELKAAVLAAKETSDLPVFATVTFDETGKLLTGADVPAVVALLEGLGADAIGINCGLGPRQLKELFAVTREYASVPVIVNPNAGLPTVRDGVTRFEVGAEEYADAMLELALLGAEILGGCCGTTPEHIRRAVEKTREVDVPPRSPKARTMVSSYGGAVIIGEKPVVIGERINPTGKKLLKQALRENDLDYITEEAFRQIDGGAHILDVNVGLPEIDEKEMMASVVTELQKITRLPLQIDSSDSLVLERALRLYNGKALVNSVNGKRESMEAVFPLVKKYGGVVVALTLDENGIPPTARGRLEIARNIIETARGYGIDKKDIIVDALTMTVSSDEAQALTTLEALTLIKETLGVTTILGVSNVSFGLPNRESVTAAFYTMALRGGLDAAIVNPCSEAVMDAYYAFCALGGYDKQCGAYIARHTKTAAPSVPSGELTLTEIIVKGLRDKAGDAAAALLTTATPTEVIDGYLIPALDLVGDGFEKGTIFLPQLLMSADTAKTAFDAIKAHMAQTGVTAEKKESIVLATVKGDIHDIGKNIVKIMLENYGYDVIDLGKNVDAQTVVDTVKTRGARLVGLSALMTTTVAAMGETIAALRGSSADCKIMVGGAVLTEEYAAMIHADYYAKDAAGAVAAARRFFG